MFLSRPKTLPLFLTNLRQFSDTIRSENNCKLLVVGGGTGGCSVAAKFAKRFADRNVIIVEPNRNHYYQPMFTLIGSGLKTFKDAVRPTGKVLPRKAEWIHDKVVKFYPTKNYILTENGTKINYEFMVVAIGLQLDYNKIPGLEEGLSRANSGVCSIYSPKYVEGTFRTLKNYKSGNLIFTFPNTPVKCAGAPQKICYLVDDYLRNKGLREKSNIIYNTSLPVLFLCEKYADALWKVCDSRNIKVNLRVNLQEVRVDKREAVFENLDDPAAEHLVLPFGFLHVTPPMSAPIVLKTDDLLTVSSGFLNVNPTTLQHSVYPNIFGIGDCTNLPTSKTAAAVAAQCGVLSENLLSAMSGQPLKAAYNGYTSCPLLTGGSKCILAEFDYKYQPLETFPINQAEERRSMFHLKKDIMPQLYWHAMLKGNWNGPGAIRDILHFRKHYI